jgi:hypothetical protein
MEQKEVEDLEVKQDQLAGVVPGSGSRRWIEQDTIAVEQDQVVGGGAGGERPD